MGLLKSHSYYGDCDGIELSTMDRKQEEWLYLIDVSSVGNQRNQSHMFFYSCDF